MYKCPRCGNEDRRYIGYRNGEPYCRRCISFSGKEATYEVDLKGKNPNLFLDYSLSEDQKKVSKDVLKILKEGKNILIYAVTGAGKTELVYESIEYFLKKQKKVGFAIPRRDVVIDLLPRVKEAFKGVKVIAVYGSHSSDIEGDIILLTTHQLYRYKNYFDLLIIDEIDAFPYRGSEVLQSFFKSSLRGNFILLTATPTAKDEEYIKENNGEKVTNSFKKVSLAPSYSSSLYKIYYIFIYKLLNRVKKTNSQKISCHGICSHYQNRANSF